jgi:uridine kinase
MSRTRSESELVAEIGRRHTELGGSRALLVALSGIDGSGKGWMARRAAERLATAGLRVASLGVDLWLNLPPVRFSAERPAEQFYQHSLRLDALLTRALLPLRDTRALDLAFDATEETATAYRPERWQYSNIEVVLVEGIFLLKRGLRPHYDLAVWLDCSFETALERALARGQEGLPPGETIRAYETIYFPAQRLHAERDDPRGGADLVVPNDPRLAGPRAIPGPAERPGGPRS